jgi:hypothetical protein
VAQEKERVASSGDCVGRPCPDASSSSFSVSAARTNPQSDRESSADNGQGGRRRRIDRRVLRPSFVSGDRPANERDELEKKGRKKGKEHSLLGAVFVRRLRPLRSRLRSFSSSSLRLVEPLLAALPRQPSRVLVARSLARPVDWWRRRQRGQFERWLFMLCATRDFPSSFYLSPPSLPSPVLFFQRDPSCFVAAVVAASRGDAGGGESSPRPGVTHARWLVRSLAVPTTMAGKEKEGSVRKALSSFVGLFKLFRRRQHSLVLANAPPPPPPRLPAPFVVNLAIARPPLLPSFLRIWRRPDSAGKVCQERERRKRRGRRETFGSMFGRHRRPKRENFGYINLSSLPFSRSLFLSFPPLLWLSLSLLPSHSLALSLSPSLPLSRALSFSFFPTLFFSPPLLVLACPLRPKLSSPDGST